MRSLCWNFSLRRLLPVAVAALFAVTGCIKDEYSTVYVGPDDPDTKEYVEMSVSTEIAPAFDFQEETKASMLNNVEGRKTGALLLVYRSGTKVLDSYRYYTAAEIANAASSPLKITVPKTKVDVFLLGNLHGIRRSDNAQVDLMTAYGDAFPMTEAALEALVYRLDGGDINTTYRRENMSEVATYGLPFLCVEKEVNIAGLPATATLPQGKATYLFSKISLTIDHKLFDGGDAAKVAYFVNKSVYLRQANVGLHPFSTTGFKAQEAADLSTATNAADYDAAMSNANKGTYVFYVPENMQGTASGISSGDQKNNSNTSIPATLRSYGTFLEFNGTLDSSAGGFGGNVKYQFFLGANNTTDFNLERGKQYNVTLEFTAGNLFGSPNWKVNPELTDSRKLWITADEANTTDIQTVNASRTLAVRKSRPGKFYLYMNPTNLGSNNYLKGKAHEKPADFVMDDMADCAWFGNLMVPGTEDYNWLANRGITASWDSAMARLTFTVTDQTKFGAATLGETREFTVKLLPDLGGAIESKFKIKLVDDLVLNVADGKSLSDEFYLGQKRTVTVTGFSGTDIRYAAIQPDCGPKTGNQMWKAGNSATDVFPTVAGSAASPVLNPTNPTYANQKVTGSLDIYAWYPNKFQSSHGWTSQPGKIVIFSEDYLNDSLEAEIVISEPRWVPWTNINGTSGSKVELNIDGTVKPMKCLYKTFNGSAELKKADFDPVLYDALLKVSMVPAQTISGKEYLTSAMGADADGGIFIERTLIDGHKLEEEDFRMETGWHGMEFILPEDLGLKMGKVRLQANPATGLFTNNTFDIEVRGFKLLFKKPVYNQSDHHSYHLPIGSGTGYVSSYFQLYDDGSGNEKIAPQDFKLDYDFRAGDKSRLQFSLTGNKITFTSGAGHEFGPKIDFSVDDNYLHWLFDPEAQVKFDGSEAIPGELLVPYGEQVFTVKYENQWDHREFTNEFTFNLMYDTGYLVPMYTFTTSTCKIYMASHRGAKLLATRGTQMTHAGRLFCLKVCGVDINNFIQYKIAFYDHDYNGRPANQRGKYYRIYDEFDHTFMKGAYSKIQDNGYMIPNDVYRESGFTSWTQDKAQDFIWGAPLGNYWDNPVFRYWLLKGPYDYYGGSGVDNAVQYLVNGEWKINAPLGSDIGYGELLDSVDGSFSGAGLNYWVPSWMKGGRGFLWMGSTAF